MRRVVVSGLAALLAVALHGADARAGDTGPVIVIPGRAGVPVMLDGVDISGAVVYGDWGLGRSGHGPIIVDGPVAYAAPDSTRGYYPSAGHAPRYGRHEVETPRRGPRPSTEYSRSWTAEPDTTRPVTEYPPFNPPAVIMAPPARRH